MSDSNLIPFNKFIKQAVASRHVFNLWNQLGDLAQFIIEQRLSARLHAQAMRLLAEMGIAIEPERVVVFCGFQQRVSVEIDPIQDEDGGTISGISAFSTFAPDTEPLTPNWGYYANGRFHRATSLQDAIIGLAVATGEVL